MLFTATLVISLILPGVAAYFALRLIKITGEALPWGLVAVGITGMLLNRLFQLSLLPSAKGAAQNVLLWELPYLTLSALLVLGLGLAYRKEKSPKSSTTQLRDSEARYRLIFENSPISIWEEDFSAVREYFDQLRAEGVDDLAAYFEKHPQSVEYCAQRVRVVEVNQATLTLHDAQDKEELVSGLVNTFTPESFNTFREELLCIWQGKTNMRRDAVVKTLAGEPRFVTVDFAVCPGYEESLAKVFVSLTDITDRKSTEHALIQSEAKYRRIFDTTQEGIWGQNENFMTTFVNTHMAEMLGYEVEEIEGRPVTEFMFKEDLADHQAKVANRKNRISESYERRFVRKDGKTIWTLISATPVFEGDKFQGSFVMATDITESKRIEKERELHTELLSKMDRINRAIQSAADLESLMKDVLDEVLNVFNCERASLLFPFDPESPTWSAPMERHKSCCSGITPPNAEIATSPEVAEMQRVALEQKGAFSYGLGNEIDIPTEMQPFSDQSGMVMALFPKFGKPWGFSIEQCSGARHWREEEKRLFEEIGRRIGDGLTGFLVLRDLQESQRQLVEAQSIAQLGNWSHDLVTGEIFWSDEFFKMLGIEPQTPSQELALKYIHPDDILALTQAVEESSASKLEHSHEFRIVRPNGEIRWIHNRWHRINDADGNEIKRIGTHQDITEQKLREAELRLYRENLEDAVRERTEELHLARDAAEAASKAKSAFLANMSHELRTPLNAILGFSHMMRQDDSLNEAQHETLDIINNSGEHLLKLINDVLEIAKIEAGKLQLQISSFDLHALVRDVSDMMRHRAEQKGLQLELDQSSEFPRYIKGDEARIRQILVNLVSNAVKFTCKGGVTIRLGVKNNTRNHLVIEVEDTGPGIDEAGKQYLFQPFVQLPPGKSQVGSGLGLSIVQQFVKLMGGVISVESEADKGSLFRVELPLDSVDTLAIDTLTKANRGNVVSLEPDQSSYRILIVEDQFDNQILLSKLMTDIGLEVKIAENGKQAIRIYDEWQPDLIWMDRRMPIMDGIEATRQIRQLEKDKPVKIVAVTASAFKEQQEEMQSAEFDGFVHKPFRFNEIYDCLGQQLGLRFVYADKIEQHSPQILDTHRLNRLPDSLRTDLHDALQSLDSLAIAETIKQVESHDKELAAVMQKIAEGLDYQTLLNALDGVS